MIGFTIAAVLLFLLSIAHSVLGERYILIRLFRRPLPPLFGDDSFTRDTLRFVWHAVTVAWWALAALLLLAPAGAEAVIGWTVAVALVVTSVLTIVISRGRHLSWVVELVAVAVLAWQLL